MSTEEERQHQRLLLAIERQNLALYLKRKTFVGGHMYATPEIVNGIATARSAIALIKQTLRQWEETVDDHPDDIERAPDIPLEENPSRAMIFRPPGRISQDNQLASLVIVVALVIILAIIALVVIFGLVQRTPTGNVERTTSPGVVDSGCPRVPEPLDVNTIPILITTFNDTSTDAPHDYEARIQIALDASADTVAASNITLLPLRCPISVPDRVAATALSQQYPQSIVLWGHITSTGGALYVQRSGPAPIALYASIVPTSTTPLGFSSLISDSYLQFVASYAASQSFFLAQNYTDTLPLIHDTMAHLSTNPAIRLEGLGQAYFQLGWSQLAVENTEIALTTLDAGLAMVRQMQPRDYEAEYPLAYHSAYLHAYYGDNAPYFGKEAEAEYQQAFDAAAPLLNLPRYKDDLLLLNLVGYIYYRQGRYDEALQHLWRGRMYQIREEILPFVVTGAAEPQSLDGSLLKNLGLVYVELEKPTQRFIQSKSLLHAARTRFLAPEQSMQLNLALFSITDTEGVHDCQYLTAAAAARQRHTYALNERVDAFMLKCPQTR